MSCRMQISALAFPSTCASMLPLGCMDHSRELQKRPFAGFQALSLPSSPIAPRWHALCMEQGQNLSREPRPFLLLCPPPCTRAASAVPRRPGRENLLSPRAGPPGSVLDLDLDLVGASRGTAPALPGGPRHPPSPSLPRCVRGRTESWQGWEASEWEALEAKKGAGANGVSGFQPPPALLCPVHGAAASLHGLFPPAPLQIPNLFAPGPKRTLLPGSFPAQKPKTWRDGTASAPDSAINK